MSDRPPATDDDIRQKLEARQHREAFELLLDRFQDKVFRLALSLLRDECQAEDTAQDVFVRIWKGLPGFKGEASFSTWIYTITRNTCFTELKKRGGRQMLSLDDAESSGGLNRLPALQTPERESGTKADVQTLLAGLPEKYRRVIALFYLEQKAYEEIAAMLGMPLGTVKAHLFRAKKELLRAAERKPLAIAPSRMPRHPSHPLPGHIKPSTYGVS